MILCDYNYQLTQLFYWSKQIDLLWNTISLEFSQKLTRIKIFKLWIDWKECEMKKIVSLFEST